MAEHVDEYQNWIHLVTQDDYDHLGRLPKTWRKISNLHALDNDGLAKLGWYPVKWEVQEGDPKTQYQGDLMYEPVPEGRYVRVWCELHTRTPEELEARIQQEWDSVRGSRDLALKNCDWVGLTDSPDSPEWLAYRQALRDITKQEDPFNIVWPEAPDGNEIA